jgi:hypothetical protein
VSYQLAFWQSNKPHNPAKVYAKVVDGRTVRGLIPLDAAVVERRLRSAFPTWTLDSSITTTPMQTAISNEKSALDVFYSPQAAVCTCYGMDHQDLNRIIDLFHELTMPLYDPQTKERFA